MKINILVYGAEAWKNISKVCSGHRQSPINIKHAQAKKKRNRSKISVQFTLENGQVYGDLQNNGHSPVFTVNASRASAQLTNVPNHRKDIYVLKKIYFRFGCTEHSGSEHQFDSVPTPGEVTTMSNHSSPKSARKICREPQAPFWKVIIYTMTSIYLSKLRR